VYPHKSVKEKIKNDLMQPVMFEWIFWTPFQMMNFWLIPPHLRVLYMNLIYIFWDTFLSYVANNDVQKKVVELKELIHEWTAKNFNNPS
jgi:protein Mpv17